MPIIRKRLDALPRPHGPISKAQIPSHPALCVGGAVSDLSGYSESCCVDQQSSDVTECSQDAIKVSVFPRVATGTYLVWDASRLPLPEDAQISSQVEYAHMGLEVNCPWDVARPWSSDRGVWLDNQQRVHGSSDNLYYRVAIQARQYSSDGSYEDTHYVSQPVKASDYVPTRMRKVYNEIVRRWERRGRHGEIREGTLLKRVRYGQRCEFCRDEYSGVQNRSQCLNCYGSGWEGGYYVGSSKTYAEFGPQQVSYKFSVDRSFYTDGPAATISLLNIPEIYPGDIWRENATDHRWILGDIVYAQSVGTVKLIGKHAAKQLDFTDVRYRIPI